MRRPLKARRGALLAAALTILIASFGVVRAEQRGGALEPAPSRPLVPVATNTVTANPDAFYGESVTLTAAVGQILSKSAFSVDQKRTGQTVVTQTGPTDMLVIAPTLNGTVDLGSYVTVIGEVVKFDPADVDRKAKDYKLDLPPDAIARYTGRPVVIATAVIDEKFVDLAKKPLPAMTADDVTLSKVMKRVGPAFTALRAGIDASNAEAAARNVGILRQAFTETEAFWKTRARADAAQWAADARKHLDLVEHAVATSKWDEAKGPAGTLGQSCATCHAVYRERLEDGTFRIKPK
jgi:cytochrome c556